MVQSKPLQSTRPSRPGGLPRFWPVLVVGLLVIVGAATYYGLQIRNERALAADKARFVQAEKDVEELSGQIVSVVGEPLKMSEKKFCSRPSVKIGDSPLSCDITKDLFYGVQDEAQATKIYKDVGAVLQKKWQFQEARSTDNLRDTKQFSPIDTNSYIYDLNQQRVFEDYKNENKVDCSGVYTYYKAAEPPFNEYAQTSQFPFIIAVDISCGDYSKAAYYPINE